MKAPSPNAYLQTKVMTASPAELRLMLFDGAVRFAQQAREGLASQQLDSAFSGITRCQDILLELINGLRPEHDRSLCEKLSALYTYMYTRLMHASSQRDPAIVDEVLKLLKFERQTWVMLLEQLAAENRAAAQAADVPTEVEPPLGGNARQGPASGLIGGVVSVRG